jgi:hypothetical protein
VIEIRSEPTQTSTAYRANQLKRRDAASVVLPKEAVVADSKFLTPEEVAERYRGGIAVGTLRNWRAMRLGPSFVKVGKTVLYAVDDLDAWDERNRVQCRASQRRIEQARDQA